MYKIVTKNGTTHLYQDGIELHGIKSISFTHDAATDKPELKVIFSGDGIEIDACCVPALPEFYQAFYRQKREGESDGVFIDGTLFVRKDG